MANAGQPAESGLRYEAARLRTFDDWPLAQVAPDVLARNGLYYVPLVGTVRCNFCRIGFTPSSSPTSAAEILRQHRMCSPGCALLTGRQTDNVPLVVIVGANQPEPVPEPEAPSTSEEHYALPANRLASFAAGWPRRLPDLPGQLSVAGFYYTGQGDRVKCFYCGGSIDGWNPDDDPWEQHALLYGNCRYVSRKKGHRYIEQVRAQHVNLRDGSPDSDIVANGVAPRPRENRRCRICYGQEYNTAFVPCGHVVACDRCATNVASCPYCRQAFTSTLRIYLT